MWAIDAKWCQNLVNISPDNDLLPDGTKPLPKSMLTCSQLNSYKETSVKF